MDGKPAGLSDEDPIPRCPGCNSCIYEDTIPLEYRKVKVLDSPLPPRHPHRETIEQACGRHYDGVSYMKYAAMRYPYDDFMLAQFGALKDFKWDLGKKYSKDLGYNQVMLYWTKNQNLGRGKKESFARRFRTIWNLGMRKNKQTLTATGIYERVIAGPDIYDESIRILVALKRESMIRDNGSLGDNISRAG